MRAGLQRNVLAGDVPKVSEIKDVGSPYAIAAKGERSFRGKNVYKNNFKINFYFCRRSVDRR